MSTNIREVVASFPFGYFDSFGRVRVSEPWTLFDSKQLNDNQPLFWDDQETSGSSTSSVHVPATASSNLSVAAGVAGTRVRQTYRRIGYQPGKGQLIFLTGVFGEPVPGVTKKVGQFDGTNGVYFQQTGAGLSIARISGSGAFTSPEVIARSDWSLDRMDGLGGARNPSGVNLDELKSQIMVIDYEWLGVGTQLLGFVVDRKIYYVHAFQNANVLADVYQSNPNLPLRYEIQSDGSNASGATLKHICTTVISEGGRQPSGIARSIDRGDTILTTLNNNALYPLLGIRLKSGHLNAQVIPSSISIICTSTSAFRWSLLLNPTEVGTALGFTSSLANSAIDYFNASGSASTVTGGTQLTSGYMLATATVGDIKVDLANDFQLGASIAGVADRLVLAVQRIGGTTESFYASMGWKESE